MKKLKINKKLIIIIASILMVVGLVVLGIVLFGKDKETATKVKKVKKGNKIEVVEPEIEPQVTIVAPTSTSRPFAVMINNIVTARPLQSGLQDAYLMYEFLVEGGITRYLALFIDQSTERIGSVRSARSYYIDYAMENDAIYCHHGQDPDLIDGDFKTMKGLDRIVVGDSKTGWRDTSLKVSREHTLFTSIEKLKSGMGSKRAERNKDLLLNYSAKKVDLSNDSNAVVANNVVIKYSKGTTSSYVYDPDTRVYKRFVNNKEHTDYVTKEQYTFKNIITYQVKYSVRDSIGHQTMDNIGSGSGYYISEGYAIPIKWEKKSRTDQTVYTRMDNSELIVNDGNTFIQIQPKDQTFTIS